jgi:hypothetical protein
VIVHSIFRQPNQPIRTKIFPKKSMFKYDKSEKMQISVWGLPDGINELMDFNKAHVDVVNEI